MDVVECREKGIIRMSRIDTNMAKSILEMSKIKETIVQDAKLDEININGFLPMAYDSLREVLAVIK